MSSSARQICPIQVGLSVAEAADMEIRPTRCGYGNPPYLFGINANYNE